MRIRETIDRIQHMMKVKDCRHICLFCEFYETCKAETATEDGGEQE